MGGKKLKGTITKIAWWAILFLFWISITNSLQIPELLAGMVGALLCVVLVDPGNAIRFVRFVARKRQLRLIYQIPKKLLTDCWLLAVVLLNLIRRRPISEGKFQTVTFPSADGDPFAVSRRAFVTALISFSPNSYVIGIDEKDDILLLHVMVPSDGEKGPFL